MAHAPLIRRLGYAAYRILHTFTGLADKTVAQVKGVGGRFTSRYSAVPKERHAPIDLKIVSSWDDNIL